MPLIYVSSSYRDLVEERTAVFDVVRRLEHHPLGMESYSAAETRPIERCLADIRQCQAYVGLIAWRYGATPSGHTKSFTRLEYEEAGNHGLPRFIFLASESWSGQRDADPSMVTAFRRAVSNTHLVREFSSLDGLRYEVVAALRSLGTGTAIPPLLPFQCDRDDQYDDLAAGLRPSQPSQRLLDRGAPIVWLAHGSEEQALNRFAQCVRERASSILETPEQQAVGWRELPWPGERSSGAFAAAFVRRLAKALGSPASRTPEEIGARIEEHSGPLVVHSRVYTDEWPRGSEALLADACNLWLNLPVCSPRWAPVLFLTVEYRDESARLVRYFAAKRNRAIRNAVLRTVGGSVPVDRLILMRELDDVKRHDVEQWAEEEPVQKLVRGEDLGAAISELFGSVLAMPMRPLAGALLSLLRAKVAAEY